MKKIICLILVMITLVGCNFYDEPQELPYGAKMRYYPTTVSKDDGTTAKMNMLADERYFNEDELEILAEYFYAVQNNDLEMFDRVMHPMFNAYINASISQGEEMPNVSNGDWLQQIYDTCWALYDKEFQFFEVEVMEYDSQYMKDELYKITGFEDAYNESVGLTEKQLTEDNVHCLYIQARVDRKYVDTYLYMFNINGEYKLMSIN